MHLYHLTLSHPSLISRLTTGYFFPPPQTDKNEGVEPDYSYDDLYTYADKGDEDALNNSEGEGQNSKITMDLLFGKERALQLVRIDDASGRMESIVEEPLFGLVRSLVRVPTPSTVIGPKRPLDFIAAATDLNGLALLRFDDRLKRFQCLSQQSISPVTPQDVPGQNLAADINGRAVVMASVKHDRSIFFVQRGEKPGSATLSLPFSLHVPDVILFDLAFVQWDESTSSSSPSLSSSSSSSSPPELNKDPLYLACLEVNYKHNPQQKQVVIYRITPHTDGPEGKEFTSITVDIVHTSEVPYSANLVLPVRGKAPIPLATPQEEEEDQKMVDVDDYFDPVDPADTTNNEENNDNSVTMIEGPGGFLICSENSVTYFHPSLTKQTLVLPQRKGFHGLPSSRPLLIVSAAESPLSESPFYLLQSELGDLYSLSLSREAVDGGELSLAYVDTVPVGNGLALLPNGWVFLAAEAGDHFLYRANLSASSSSASFLPSPSPSSLLSLPCVSSEEMEKAEDDTPLFVPHKLTALTPADRFDSSAPILGAKVTKVPAAEGGGEQLYSFGGKGERSGVNIIRHGLAVDEVTVSTLHAIPNGIWTLKSNHRQQHHSYIVVSFANGTLVLSLNGDVVEEVADEDSGFLGEHQTLLAAEVGSDGMVQVHPNGFRYINPNTDTRYDWSAPLNRTILHAAANYDQVVIALSGGDIVIFELLEEDSSQLSEVTRRELGHEITCIDLAPSRQEKLLAVGDMSKTVRLYSLVPEEQSSLSELSVDHCPQSLCFLTVPLSPHDLSASHDHYSSSSGLLSLSVGLQNGSLIRTLVDPRHATISGEKPRAIGTKPVQLFKVQVGGQTAMFVKSNRCWLRYSHQSRFIMTPLSYIPIQWATSLSTKQCPNGVVGFLDSTLRIFTIDRLSSVFNQVATPIRYTPKKMVIHPNSHHALVLECAPNSLSVTHDAEEISSLSGPIENSMKKQDEEDEFVNPDSMEVTDDKSTEVKNLEAKQQAETYARQRKAAPEKDASHHWVSCLRVIDLRGHQTVSVKEMEKGLGCYSICVCTFLSRPSMRFVVVGTAKEIDPVTKKASGGCFIELYSFNEETGALSLFEKTPVEGIPTAVCPFQGKLLVGIGNTLRLYDLGKRKLIRKCENSEFASSIHSIHTSGQRIYVSDVSQSMFFCVYRRPENAIAVVALDKVPRWATCTELLDHDTVACGDRFGNVFVLRLRASYSDAIAEREKRGTDHLALAKMDGSGEEEWSGTDFSTPYKLDCVVNFHVGDVITSVSKSTIVAGASQMLLYTTLFGGIGAFLPVIHKEDIVFLKKLEVLMRNHVRPLCGHDHLSFRSSFGLAQGVVDGDLCEQYWSLDFVKQKEIASELFSKETHPSEVLNKLEDFQESILFVPRHSNAESSAPARS